MIPAFTLATLRCACGSADILSIDPGRDAELDPVFHHIVLHRAIAARGWCMACVDAFAPLLPHEAGRTTHG